MTATPPALICLNETFLDGEVIEFPGYVEVARRDRGRGKERGGVLIFASAKIAPKVTFVHSATDAERIWVTIHSSMGEVLVGNWYSTPGNMDHDGSIHTLRHEHAQL